MFLFYLFWETETCMINLLFSVHISNLSFIFPIFVCNVAIFDIHLMFHCSFLLVIPNLLFWRRKWQPAPVLLPGKFQEWGSLAGYSPWGRKELDTTEQLHFLSCYSSFWRRKWQPTPVFFPGESHGQRGLAGLRSMGLQSRTRLSNYHTHDLSFDLKN